MIQNDKSNLEIFESYKSLEKWKFFFKIFIIILIIIMVIFLYKNDKNYEHLAIIEIDGIITHENKNNAKNIILYLNEAFENKKAKAIVIKINSPGGSPVQANIIYKHIKNLRKKNIKPIISVIEDIGTSASYLISTSTEKIFCDQSSIIGSIGVLSQSFGFVELIKKIGIERRVYSSGPNKTILDPFIDKTNKSEEIILESIKIIHNNFVNIVKNNRPLINLKDDDIFSGRFWIGEDALKLGLIDGFDDIYNIASNLIEVDKIINYNNKPKIPEILNHIFNGDI
jgi:protease IV